MKALNPKIARSDTNEESKVICCAVFVSGSLVYGVGNSYAQAPQVVAVGSSGAFTSTVAAMTLPDSVQGFSSAVCGSNVWTAGNSTAAPIYAVDPRSGSIPTEPGTVAVVWDNSTSPNNVCVYLSIDSIVGLRLFLAQSGSGGVSGNGFPSPLTPRSQEPQFPVELPESLQRTKSALSRNG